MAETIRVLLVDEDADVVAVTGEFLERADGKLAVESTTRATDALDGAVSNEVDAVVTDDEMPSMTGADLAAELHENATDVPVVLYTARERSGVNGALGDQIAAHVRKRTGRDQYDELAAQIREDA